MAKTTKTYPYTLPLTKELREINEEWILIDAQIEAIKSSCFTRSSKLVELIVTRTKIKTQFWKQVTLDYPDSSSRQVTLRSDNTLLVE